MPKGQNVLIRAHLFKWWTPGVADVVERQGATVAWYFDHPKGNILTLRAAKCGFRLAKQITLTKIDLYRLDAVAEMLREMNREIEAAIAAGRS